MPDLTAAQYELVYAMLSLTIASMGASAAFFLIGRSQVGEKYRPALLVSGLVVAQGGGGRGGLDRSWEVVAR